MQLSRIVLIRHGETLGESSIRYHGATDVALSREGVAQAHAARRAIPGDGFDRIVSSTLMRAWQTALVVARGRAVQLEPDFREVHFGRWEGLTREEIAARDPILYEDWQAAPLTFGFPEGEERASFRARVERGLARLMARGDTESAIIVAHKGVVRTIADALTGEALGAEAPPLGGVVTASRGSDDRWHLVSQTTPAPLADRAGRGA
jgi:broad specificity phosphatase PhoE